MMNDGIIFLADVVVQQFLPYPIGFAFLFFVLLSESTLLGKLLSKSIFDRKIWTTVIIANLLTTLLGLIVYKQPAGLLSYTSVDSYAGELLFNHVQRVFIQSFIMTIAVELPFNAWRLHGLYAVRKILIFSLMANILTYAVAVVIYLAYAISRM